MSTQRDAPGRPKGMAPWHHQLITARLRPEGECHGGWVIMNWPTLLDVAPCSRAL